MRTAGRLLLKLWRAYDARTLSMNIKPRIQCVPVVPAGASGPIMAGASMGLASSRPAHVHRRGLAAFTLPEVLVAAGLVGFLFVSLYAGITASFGVISVARENIRATQIMQDRMEEMRLYTWTQITTFGSSTSYIPSFFTEPFFPTGTNYSGSTLSTNNNPGSGFFYYGTLSVTNSGLTEAYSNDLKLVTVTLKWTNGTARTRTLSTMVSQYGMQNYIY